MRQWISMPTNRKTARSTILFTVLLGCGAFLRQVQAADFYVDADYAGGTRNGTASDPWQSLSDTATNNPWSVINGSPSIRDLSMSAIHSARTPSFLHWTMDLHLKSPRSAGAGTAEPCWEHCHVSRCMTPPRPPHPIG